MPIGKVWIYRFLFCLFLCLFVCLFVCVCTVIDVSGEDKASGVKFCMLVHRRPGQEARKFPILGNFALKSPKSDESALGGKYCR